VKADGSRFVLADPTCLSVALLAHEAAGAIARADAMDNLADEAQTDALTGLPNRRAWDAHLKRAMAEQQVCAIAILDFDRFKQFNDTYGHPAGDRLLKETAAAWRDQLRAVDVLARIGGEEFGLLLPDCDAVTAQHITDRLRRHVAHDRTCSVGIAVREPSETTDAVIARADLALYQAKARGRDRTHLASEPGLGHAGLTGESPGSRVWATPDLTRESPGSVEPAALLRCSD